MQAQGGRPLHPRQGQLRRRHHPPGHAAHGDPAQPVRARPHRLDRHVRRGRGAAGRRGGRHRRGCWPRTTSPGCRPSRATPRPCWRPTRCASRARRSRRSIAETAYIAKDALELIEVDYEPLPAVTTPAAGAGRRRAADPRRQGGADLEPRLPLGGRRQGGDRPRLRRGRSGGRAGHLLPALPPGAARDRGCVADVNPATGKATIYMTSQAPHAHRTLFAIVAGPARAPDPDRLARHRRRLRQQGADLPRLRRRDRGVAADRPAGEVDRGPHREPDLDRVRPRLPHARRAGAQGRPDGRACATSLLSDQGAFYADAQPTKFRPACSTSSPAPTTSRPRTSSPTARTPTRRRAGSPTAARSGSPRPRT